MKKTLLFAILAVFAFTGNAQQSLPTGSKLLSSSFYQAPDGGIYHYKGSQYLPNAYYKVANSLTVDTLLSFKVDKVSGKSLLADAEIIKLLGIQTGATKNQSDSFLLARANHTGTQPISTVANLQTTLDGKANLIGGNNFTGGDQLLMDGSSFISNRFIFRDMAGAGDLGSFTTVPAIPGVKGVLNLSVSDINGSNKKTVRVAPLNASDITGSTVNINFPGTSGTLINRYNLNTFKDSLQTRSEKGTASGYASLDINGKVPLTQINDALLGAVNYRGNYDASNNTPALPVAATANKGYYWIVSVAGTQQGLSLRPGDWIISNGITYGRVASSADVESVAGRKGVVVLTKNDVGLNNVDNTADANKPVSTPQSIALNSKLNLSGGTLTGAFFPLNGTIDNSGIYHNGLLSVGGSGAFGGRVQSPLAPVTGNDFTNKTYVDGLVSSTGIGYAKIDGSNATGNWNNSASYLKSYKSASNVFLGWDGFLNLRIDGTDFGKTFPIDITGASVNSSLLNGYAPAMTSINNSIAQRDQFARLVADRFRYDNVSTDDGPLSIIMGMSGTDKGIYRFTIPTVKAALATSLQDATLVSGISSKIIEVTGNTRTVVPSVKATYLSQDPNGSGVVESFDFRNNSSNPLSLNPNGGNVGVGTNNPAYKLAISNNGANGFEVDPTTGGGGAPGTTTLSYNRTTNLYTDRLDLMKNYRISSGGGTGSGSINLDGNVGISGTLTGTSFSGNSLALAPDNATSDPYAAISVTRTPANENTAYYGLTKSGTTAYMLGISNDNRFSIGTGTRGNITNHAFLMDTGGNLSLNGSVSTSKNPTSPEHLARKDYVDSRSQSGLFTPTGSSTVGLTTLNFVNCKYSKVGNMVTVFGFFQIEASSTETITFNMTKPVVSADESANHYATGSIASINNANVGYINSANGTIKVQCKAISGGGTQGYSFSYSYMAN